MKFNRYNISIIFQIILIALTSAAFVWTLSREFVLVTSITLFALWIIEIIFLVWYLHRNNRQVIRFLQSFKYRDGTLSFSKSYSKGASPDLYLEFEQIISSFEKIKLEKEKEYLFLDHVIQHAATGLLAIDDKGSVLLHNKALLSIFGIGQIRNINSLNRIKKGLSSQLEKIKTGKQELIRINFPTDILQLAVKAAEILSGGQKIRIYSFQDIKTEIEAGEIEAWQKLIRILNHEILNSVSPINLLTVSLIDLLQKDPVEKMQKETVDQSIHGLEVIRKRSKGLTNFVESYRSATRISEPRFNEFMVESLFDQIYTLMEKEIETNGIRFDCHAEPENLKLIADEKLVEQVLINLVKNSIQALDGITDPLIELTATGVYGSVSFYIKDNGNGIKDEIIDQVFSPFFTTKEGGSGIGLSLSRQIMRMHKGSIGIQSKEGVGTIVVLKF